jgi:hypothetical protein
LARQDPKQEIARRRLLILVVGEVALDHPRRFAG